MFSTKSTNVKKKHLEFFVLTLIMDHLNGKNIGNCQRGIGAKGRPGEIYFWIKD